MNDNIAEVAELHRSSPPAKQQWRRGGKGAGSMVLAGKEKLLGCALWLVRGKEREINGSGV